jgi:trehalose 6-phosphate phosphatase
MAILLDDLRRAVEAAGRVLVALDFDGTLAPIVPHPEDAAIPAETGERLRGLSCSEHCSVAVISGRSVADLQARVGLDLIYGGNHGLEIEGHGVSFVHPEAELLRHAVDYAAWDLQAALEAVSGVFIEHKGLTATVHYRQAHPDLADWIGETVTLVMRPYSRWLNTTRARKAWEIRPRLKWNKGSAVRMLLERLSPRPLLVCAGDDETDEDMFRVSQDAISIKVGDPARTRARYHVPTTRDFLPCLDVLLSTGAILDPVKP